MMTTKKMMIKKSTQRGALRKEVRLSYIRFASFRGEYNITETTSFNITLRDKAKYHCETCLTISLITFILEIGIILKYLTHYDTFDLEVSFFI